MPSSSKPVADPSKSVGKRRRDDQHTSEGPRRRVASKSMLREIKTPALAIDDNRITRYPLIRWNKMALCLIAGTTWKHTKKAAARMQHHANLKRVLKVEMGILLEKRRLRHYFRIANNTVEGEVFETC